VTVYAQDLDPTHVDTAYVQIRVTDYNDNAPLFVPNSKKVRSRLPYHTDTCTTRLGVRVSVGFCKRTARVISPEVTSLRQGHVMSK